jgi:hypothetical protein
MKQVVWPMRAVSFLFALVVFSLATPAAHGQSLSPSLMSFPNTAVTNNSAAKPATLTNTGSSAISVSVSMIGGDFDQTNNCGLSLASKQSCTINVVFNPTNVGVRAALLNVRAGSRTDLALLTGTAIPQVTLSATSMTFASQIVGTSSAAKTVSLKNNQNIAMPVQGVTITGDYTQTNNCGPQLAAGASCTVNVIFKPTAAGTRTGMLSIRDSAVTSPEDVSLSGPAVSATVKSIAVSPATASIVKGKTQQFTAIATYTNNATGDVTASATWTSSNAAIATVSKGLATGVAVGSATMTASVTGSTITGKATMTVTVPTLLSISVTPNPVSVAKGKTQQFAATGTYSDGSTQALTSVTWSSTTGATITTSGLATATAVGSPSIKATSGTISGTAAMTVTPATLVSIAVTPATATIPKGKTQQFAATGTFTDGTTQNLTATATWTSAAGATIATGGLATGTAVGAPVITAASGAISGHATLTVQAAALVSIAVTPATATIPKGKTQQFTAAGTYTDGTTQVLTATWTAGTGATVTSSGLATGTAVGAPSIKATSGTISGSAILTVQPAALVSIAVTPANAALAKGLTQQYVATGTYTDATAQNLTSTVIWSSTAEASIIPGGLATAMTVGTPTITATSGAISGAAVLTVQPAALVSITVSPSAASIGRGSTQQFTATGTYTDITTQDITNTVSWNATAGATMAPTGVATATATGNTTITAALNSITGTASLNVVPPALVSINVTPGSASLGLHGQQQFMATGYFADSTLQDITNTVIWTSGNNSLVSVTAGGLAKVLGTSTSAIPVIASSGSIVSNPAWLSAVAALPPVCSSPTIDMKLLVITNGKTEADFPAIKQALDYLGTPYDVFDMAVETGGITAPMLSDGNCHGYYQGVIFTFGNWMYILPGPGYSDLMTYEQTYHVRQLNWFVYPGSDYGFNTYNNSVDAYSTYTANFTPAADQVFSYANTATPLNFSNAFIYLASPNDGSVTPVPAGATITPLLTDNLGNALSVIYNPGDGREYLSQTFDSNQYLMHNLVTSYGLINWVTKGVFLGEFHVYAIPQVDDVFINDHEWVGTTPCFTNNVSHDRTDSDADTLGTVRMVGSDVDALLAWQQQKQQNPLLSNFVLHMAFNGMGTTGDVNLGGYNPDTLTPEFLKYQSDFKWISHTWDHPDTLNGQTAAFIDDEILKNNQQAQALGLTYYSPANMVTPGVTGLNDSIYVNRAVADGVKYVVTDTSVLNTPNNGPNPSPNVGMVDTLNNGLYLVPRHANNLYFNVATPDGWTSEYQCIYSGQTPYSTFNYQNILDNISQSFVANMVKGDMDPQMFHQPNLVAYDGTHSLIGDLYDETFNLYLNLFKLPVLSPTLDQVGQSMQQRNNYNLSAVKASLVNAGSVDASVSITVPTGTVTSAIIPVTGLSSNGSENYGGQSISHIPVNAGDTVALPLQ